MIAVSIVSHGHGVMVWKLVEQLLVCPEVGQIIVTNNIPEACQPSPDRRVDVIFNPSPKGFGANHNAAFHQVQTPFWCVLNPDIELVGNPFPVLLAAMKADTVGLVAPRITNLAGQSEDSIRHFPTPKALALKLVGMDNSRYEFDAGAPVFCPDWVAGMFMLFRVEAYRQLEGFDEGYFLYYEDVDICVRAWNAGLPVLACPSVTAIHDAQRASRVSWKHRRWHLASMIRYLLKYFGRLPQVGKMSRGVK